MITAYTLTFGGLLLLGGRIADRFGRRRTFLFGLAGFALASALGGAAPTFAILVAGPCSAGRFRRTAGPDGTLAARDHVHRAARTGEGVRRLRSHRR
jgi:MFS family permease